MDVDSLELIRPRSISCEHVTLEAFNTLSIGELIDYDFSKMNLYKLYSASDQLLKNKDAIERPLYLQEKNSLVSGRPSHCMI